MLYMAKLTQFTMLRMFGEKASSIKKGGGGKNMISRNYLHPCPYKGKILKSALSQIS